MMRALPEEVLQEMKVALDKYEDDLTQQIIAANKPARRQNYRKLPFNHYGQFGQIICAICGFGILAVLEVARLDGNRSHNNEANLAILCPTCHRMHDIGLIPTETILLLRDSPRVADWAKNMKGSGAKAAATRRKNVALRKEQEAAMDKVSNPT